MRSQRVRHDWTHTLNNNYSRKGLVLTNYAFKHSVSKEGHILGDVLGIRTSECKSGGILCVCSVTSVVSDSLWPYGLWHSMLLISWDSLARILEWVAMPSSKGSTWPRDQTQSPVAQVWSHELQVGSLLLSHQGSPLEGFYSTDNTWPVDL